MSWDVSVFGAKVPPPPVFEMPRDWRGESLGALDDVRRRISSSLPEVNWSDPSWGIYSGDGFTFEFNIGSKEPSDGFMVHVRGSGDAVRRLLQMAECWSWYLLDCSQGEWLHHSPDIVAGWKGFQVYRDQVLGRSGATTDISTGVGRQIEMGFASTPSPGDRFEDISATEQDEGIVNYFRGTSWRGHAVGDLRHHCAALSFFTGPAFRFWLPAFMLASLEDAKTADVIPESIASNMREPARLTLFTHSELSAIAAFLQDFSVRYDDESFRTIAEQVRSAANDLEHRKQGRNQ